MFQDFLDRGTQASFAGLVRRHGPMVLGDGRKLAVADADAAIHVCDVRARTSTALPWRRRGAPLCLEFSPDGRLLAVGGKTPKWDVFFVTLWDLANSRELISLAGGDANAAVALAFDRNGDRLAVAGKDRTAELWRLRPGR